MRKKNRTIPLKHQLLDLAYKLSQEVEEGPVNRDNISGGMYSHESTEAKDYFLKSPIVIMDVKLFRGLTARACKLLMIIMEEMQMNNVFWLTAKTDPHRRQAICELKRHGILIATERAGLFIINPFKLRRGKPMAAVMASIDHWCRENKVEQLEELHPPKKGLIYRGDTQQPPPQLKAV
jgi:hypothetical protein